MSNLVWSREECTPTIAIPMKTKGVFSDISYVVKKNQMQVSLNLTERVPVLMNGLVSLLNTTITLYAKQNANGCNLKLRGTGKETILGKICIFVCFYVYLYVCLFDCLSVFLFI